MVKLLFDLKATQPNTSGKRHGGGRYGEIIFKRMVERKINFSCFYDSRKWLNPEIESLCHSLQIPLFDIKDNKIEDIVQKNGIARIYSALPGKLALLNCCDVYGTIHGLREFETPFDKAFYKYKHAYKDIAKFTLKMLFKHFFYKMKRRNLLKLYTNNSFHIVTVSNHSRHAFYSYFPELRNKKIPVFYSPNTSGNDKYKKGLNEKYLMLVSGNRWEKNNLRVIMAFDRLISNELISKDIRMKVTGATEHNYKYKIKNPASFDFLGYVDDCELEHLYANAYAFVYPSLNEGFGYPPLEAMKYCVPVIASPFSSISEVCGGSVLYFNPFSIEEIMNRILMVLETPLHTEYSRKGHEQYVKIKQRQDADLDALIDFILN